VDTSCLTWQFRKNHLVNVIHQTNADIVCLYEVDHYEDYFKPELEKLGYTGLWKMKFYTGHSEANDGTAVFWKINKFQLNSHNILQYEQSTQFSHLVKLTSITSTVPSVCLAATHLKAKRGFEDKRLSQGIALTNALREFNSENLPVIICGDMNDAPDSPVSVHFRKHFTSAYSHEDNSTWTTWKLREEEVKRTIDYIYYDSQKLVATHVLEIPSDAQCPTRFPAAYYPSDHIAVAARFATL